MCDRVGVLYAGELVEEGDGQRDLRGAAAPVHGRAAALHPAPLASARTTVGWTRSPASCRSLANRSPGCIFAPRCADRRGPAADEASPPAYGVGPGRVSRCYRHEQPRPTAAHHSRRRRAAVGAAGGRRPRRPPAASRRPSLSRRAVQALARGRPGPTARRDARAGRRVGQRQDDAGAGAARPDAADPVRSSSWTARRCRRGPRAHRASSCKALQIVFQNPDSALNRRHTMRRLIARPLVKLAGLYRRRAPRRGWPTWCGRSGWRSGTCRCGRASCRAA